MIFIEFVKYFHNKQPLQCIDIFFRHFSQKVSELLDVCRDVSTTVYVRLRNVYQERFNIFKYFSIIGGALKSEDIISSHIVHSEMDCSLKCLGEQTCVGYNFRPKSKKHEINCQLGSNSSLERDIEIVKNGEWVFSQDLDSLPVSL